MSVDIRVWGRAAWDLLYSIAFAYPEAPSPSERAAAVSLFRGLEVLLPCPDCCRHFAAYMREFPIERNASSRAELCAWLVQLNNRVNARTGKPPTSLPAVWDRLVEGGPVHRQRFWAAGTFLVIAIVGFVIALLWWRRSTK